MARTQIKKATEAAKKSRSAGRANKKAVPVKKAAKKKPSKQAQQIKKQIDSKKAEAETAAVDAEDLVEESSEKKNGGYGAFEASVETSFFYTSDHIINAMDDEAIMRHIAAKFPNLSQNSTDGVLRKEIVAFVNDKDFVAETLKFYNLSVFDLFKLLYKNFSTIFKGPFLKKLRDELRYKRYTRITRPPVY